MKTIDVTATVEITFKKKITAAQFKELEAGDLDIEDIVDDSEPYELLRSEGTFEYDWDFTPDKKKDKKK